MTPEIASKVLQEIPKDFRMVSVMTTTGDQDALRLAEAIAHLLKTNGYKLGDINWGTYWAPALVGIEYHVSDGPNETSAHWIAVGRPPGHTGR